MLCRRRSAEVRRLIRSRASEAHTAIAPRSCWPLCAPKGFQRDGDSSKREWFCHRQSRRNPCQRLRSSSAGGLQSGDQCAAQPGVGHPGKKARTQPSGRRRPRKSTIGCPTLLWLRGGSRKGWSNGCPMTTQHQPENTFPNVANSRRRCHSYFSDVADPPGRTQGSRSSRMGEQRSRFSVCHWRSPLECDGGERSRDRYLTE